MNLSPSQVMLGMCTHMVSAACYFFFLTAFTANGVKTQTCGKSQNKVAPESTRLLIHHGRNASLGDFPWQAVIYTPLDEGKWTQICGGTLISPQLVLTAAHCFEINMRQLQPLDIKVGLAKVIVDFSSTEQAATTVAVKQIIKPERYVGFQHYYSLDVTLLVLAESVQTNNNIMPACIDWEAANRPQQNEFGFFAGFGATETSFRSNILKWAFLKYISYNTCLSSIVPTEQRFIVHDKFCCQEEKGKALDRGDSGGGVTFLREDDRHYVYGVLSAKPLSDNTQISLFTDLMNREHLYWLTQQWKQIEPPSRPTINSTLQPAENSDNVRILAAVGNDVRLYNTSTLESFQTLYSGESYVHRVDYHWGKGLVFFNTNKKMYRLPLFGHVTTSVTVIKSFKTKVLFTVDWVQGRIYWTESPRFRTPTPVRSMDLDGNDDTVLIQGVARSDIVIMDQIVVDPYERVLFYSGHKTIVSYPLAGHKNSILRVLHKVDQVIALALDMKSQRVFYTNCHSSRTYPCTLNSMNYDGSDVREHLDNQDLGFVVYHIALFRDVLYWHMSSYTSRLYKLPLNASDIELSKSTLMKSSKEAIYDIKVFHPEFQRLPKEPKTLQNHRTTGLMNKQLPMNY